MILRAYIYMNWFVLFEDFNKLSLLKQCTRLVLVLIFWDPKIAKLIIFVLGQLSSLYIVHSYASDTGTRSLKEGSWKCHALFHALVTWIYLDLPTNSIASPYWKGAHNNNIIILIRRGWRFTHPLQVVTHFWRVFSSMSVA